MAWKPGQSGNPDGRKIEKPFADALRMEIAAVGADHKALREIAKKLLELAGNGEGWAIREIADRLDGKPAQAMQLTGDPDNPLEIRTVNDTEAAREVSFLLARAVKQKQETAH